MIKFSFFSFHSFTGSEGSQNATIVENNLVKGSNAESKASFRHRIHLESSDNSPNAQHVSRYVDYSIPSTTRSSLKGVVPDLFNRNVQKKYLSLSRGLLASVTEILLRRI